MPVSLRVSAPESRELELMYAMRARILDRGAEAVLVDCPYLARQCAATQEECTALYYRVVQRWHPPHHATWDDLIASWVARYDDLIAQRDAN